MSTNYNYPWPTQSFPSQRYADVDVADRQDRVPGLKSGDLAKCCVLLIGAGGFGSAIGRGLTRKGVGRLEIADFDRVEFSNLARQFFFARDVGEPKALCLARNVAREGFLGGTTRGHFAPFVEDSAPLLAVGVDVAICATDNNASRALAASFFRERRVPVIFTATSETASFGYVFVQAPSGPCLACVYPRVLSAPKAEQPCEPVPAVADVLFVLAGIVLYSVDSLVSGRQRFWNYRSIELAGGGPDLVCTVHPRPSCALCHGGEER